MLPGSLNLAGRRVLMTADAVGGVLTYAGDLAAGLGKQGVSVTLAVLGPGLSRERRDALSVLPGISVVETGLPLDWLADSPDAVLAAGRAVAALARKVGADLVHLNSPALAADGAFDQPVLGVCHSCVATWWDAVRGIALPHDFAWRTDLVRRGYASCDALVAPSRAFADATARTYGLPPPLVVHNGRASGHSGRLPDETVAGAPIRPFVFTAGRLWDEGKGIETLDRAAALIAAPVLAAGPTTGPNGAEVKFRDVRALGTLTPGEVAAYLARRPIYSSPARYEPFGLSVLEAAEAGCPLVLADIPTFRELWDGVALFVPPRDARALAVALDGLAFDSERRELLGRSARAHAARFGVDPMTDRMGALYSHLLEREEAGAKREILQELAS